MEFLRRLWFLLRRRDLGRDLEEEMLLHRDLKVQQHIAAGMSPDQAKRQARLDFGNVSLAAERSRERWGFPLLESTIQDLAYGVRQIARHPGFTAVVVLTLALGIGANTAIFSVVNAFLLKSLPVANPEELVRIGIQPSGEFEQSAYEYLRDHQRTLSGLIAWDEGNITAIIDGNSTVIPVDYVSGNLYSLLGVDVIAGRAFTSSDDLPGTPAVAVISYAYWRDRFGLDQSVLGKTLLLKDIRCTIVGVSRPGFRGLRTGGPGPSITIPAQWHSHLTLKDNTSFSLFGRMPTGSDLKNAGADLNLVYHQWLIPEAGKINDPQARQALLRSSIAITRAPQGSLAFNRRFIVQLRLVEAVVALVLLVACVNLANLLLARGTSRSREIAVRLALGARRGRIVRQLLTENLFLALCGGALGLLLSMPLVRVFSFVLSGRMDTAALGIGLDRTVLGFTAILSIATGIFFGLLPALRSPGGRISPRLRDQAIVVAGRRFQARRLLIVPQVAISLMVLILAGLLLRSLQQLQKIDLGFERNHLLSFWLMPTLSGYEDQRELDLYDGVIAGINRLPGVRAASLSRLALLHRGKTRGLAIDGAVNPDVPFVFNTAAPRFFDTLRLPILNGRDFITQDTPRSPSVAIINQSMARKYFPSLDPIGHRIALSTVEPGVERTIIGVVKDMKFSFRDDMPAAAVYLPYAQAPADLRGQAEIKVSTTLDPASVIPAIRNQVHTLAKDLPPIDIVSVDQDLQADENREERSLARLFGGFGALALGLALLGLYGTVSYSVSQRLREFAIRFALGANQRDLLWMIVSESLRYVLIGVVLGVSLAAIASRTIESFLFEIRGFDPATYAGLIVGLFLTAMGAAYLPARRARRIDPMLVLRCE